MTANIRAAALAEARGADLHRELSSVHYTRVFTAGAVWAAARVTPTREQVRQVIVGGADWEHGFRNPYEIVEAMTDAILALMTELAEGESDE